VRERAPDFCRGGVEFEKSANVLHVPKNLYPTVEAHNSEAADVLHDSTPVTITGHSFFRGNYRRAGLRQATYMTAIARVRRDLGLCFIFTSSSPEGIESLVSSLQTLAFSGDDSSQPK
jgi:hypothetical protein